MGGLLPLYPSGAHFCLFLPHSPLRLSPQLRETIRSEAGVFERTAGCVRKPHCSPEKERRVEDERGGKEKSKVITRHASLWRSPFSDPSFFFFFHECVYMPVNACVCLHSGGVCMCVIHCIEQGSAPITVHIF